MLGKLIKGMAGLRVVDQEHEIPDWMGALLDGGGLVKGAGHKYLRRVPKAGGGYRYFYNVTGGQGLGHHAEMVAGAAFKVKHAGKEGHFHVTADHGEEVTVRHDESGHEQKMSKAALRAMLHAEHAEPLRQARERAAKTLEQAQKTGTAKQQEKAAALVSKYSGDADNEFDASVGKALASDPAATLRALGQKAVGMPIQFSSRKYNEKTGGDKGLSTVKGFVLSVGKYGVDIIEVQDPTDADYKRERMPPIRALHRSIPWGAFSKEGTQSQYDEHHKASKFKLRASSALQGLEGMTATNALEVLKTAAGHGLFDKHTNNASHNGIQAVASDMSVHDLHNVLTTTRLKHPALNRFTTQLLDKYTVKDLMKVVAKLAHQTEDERKSNSIEKRAQEALGLKEYHPAFTDADFWRKR
jgi:hypothetical protein